MTMQLEFTRFQRAHFAEYATWFEDSELNRHLRPMDQDWLEAVLAQPESEGVTWAIFHDTELVAVVETCFDPEHPLPAVITAVATKPSRRGQGIASTALQQILSLNKLQGHVDHVVYVSIHNPAGLGRVEKAGFVPVTSEPDEHGFIKFRQ